MMAVLLLGLALLLLLLHSSTAFLSTPNTHHAYQNDALFTSISSSIATWHELSSLVLYSSTSSSSSSSSSQPVSVYNNVISKETCRHLHKLTLESTQRSRDGSFLFRRPINSCSNDDATTDTNNNDNNGGQQQRELTPLETTIHQILNSLNDTSPIVEYWSRKEYINMDAHADIDEDVLKDEGVLRCPVNGHVLYLQIANDNDSNGEQDVNINRDGVGHGNNEGLRDQVNRMGPTVIFPSKRIAWGTVTPRTQPSPSLASYKSQVNLEERCIEYIVDVENYWTEEERKQYGLLEDNNGATTTGDGDDATNTAGKGGEQTMAIVPAVSGRLLRFDGAAFHSVPKPPNRYLLSKNELTTFLEKESEKDCDEDDGYGADDYDDDYWDDDDDDEYDSDDEEDEEDNSNNSNLRSVLLFNTWSEGSGGPRGVQEDRIVNEIVPDGICIESEDDGNDDDESGGADPIKTFLEEERRGQWEERYGKEFGLIHCNPFSEWAVQEIDEHEKMDGAREVTIPLMGNPSRRGVLDNKDDMQSVGVSSDQFYDGQRVSLVTLEKKGKKC